ncbi:MAG: LON peptidase substrate-binding domain-containing protein, partial [Gaiellaceae bacterium]
DRSIALVDDVLAGDRLLALVAVDNDVAETPGWDDVYRVGTAAIVHKMIRVPDGTLRVLVQGLRRVRIEREVQDDPYLVAELTEQPDVIEESRELEALTRNVQTQFGRIIGLVPYLPEELQIAAANVDDPSALCSLVASTIRLKTEEKQQLLELVDVSDRLREVSVILNRELEMVELGSKIQLQVQSELEKGQREFFLRQQLKAIQQELGEGDPEQAEASELRERLDALGELPEEVRKAADRELGRLEKLPSAAAEYGVIRTYLEWILTLPWSSYTEDNLDLDHAREVLDTDHFDLEKVKDRIIEYLAVAKLRNAVSGQILCFVGPPGVGKTSLGHSIARALGRKFVRLSVGGVHDEAEIRGHRRTYIGSMPGAIIRSLRDAESSNPVLLIDELDKMGNDWRGDPASAMLEVLDPEQNSTFRDHYLDVPFDLSNV